MHTQSNIMPAHSDVLFDIRINDVQQRILAKAMRMLYDNMQYYSEQDRHEARALRELLCEELTQSPCINSFVL